MSPHLTLTDVDRDPVLNNTLPVYLRGRAVVAVACAAPEDRIPGWRAIKGTVAILNSMYESRCAGAIGPEAELAVMLPLAGRSYFQHRCLEVARVHALDADTLPRDELLQLAEELDLAVQGADAPRETLRAACSQPLPACWMTNGLRTDWTGLAISPFW